MGLVKASQRGPRGSPPRFAGFRVREDIRGAGGCGDGRGDREGWRRGREPGGATERDIGAGFGGRRGAEPTPVYVGIFQGDHVVLELLWGASGATARVRAEPRADRGVVRGARGERGHRVPRQRRLRGRRQRMNFRLKIVSKYKQVIRYEPQASFGSVVLLESVVQGDRAASVDDEIEVDEAV